jgi:hypothetical protein
VPGDRAFRAARGFALLMVRPKKRLADPEDAKLVTAIDLGQSELFPLEKPKPAAFQLRWLLTRRSRRPSRKVNPLSFAWSA